MTEILPNYNHVRKPKTNTEESVEIPASHSSLSQNSNSENNNQNKPNNPDSATTEKYTKIIPLPQMKIFKSFQDFITLWNASLKFFVKNCLKSIKKSGQIDSKKLDNLILSINLLLVSIDWTEVYWKYLPQGFISNDRGDFIILARFVCGCRWKNNSIA